MPTFRELEQAAISRYESGDIEGAKRLKKQALAQQEHELIAGQAIAAFENGDVKSAKALKKQALDILAPYEESTFTDIGRGLVVAPVTVAQGIAEFAAAGLDLSLGTEYARPVTEAFEGFKKEHDLDPKTTAGEVTEELLGFGLGFIPIAGWLGRASSVAKGANLARVTTKGAKKAKSRFFRSADAFGESATGKALLKSRTGLIGTTALATGAYETLVTPDGRATMSDAFDVMPLLQTEDTSQMEGSDLAGGIIRNKLRRGFEGGFASLTFDVGLPVAGIAARSLGTVPGVSAVTSTLARTSSSIFNAAGRQIGKIPGVGASKKFLTEQLSATGTKYAKLAEEILDVEAVGADAQRTALKFFEEWENSTGQFMTIVDVTKKTKKQRAKLEKDLYKFLTEANSTALDGYTPRAKQAAERMLKLDLDFQDSIFKELELRHDEMVLSGKVNPGLKSALEDVKAHKASTAGFLRRRFKQYDNKEEFYKQLDIEGPAFKSAYKELRTALENKNLQKPLTGIQKLQVKFEGAVFPEAPYSSKELDEMASSKLYEYIGLAGAKDVPDAKRILTELQNSFKVGRTEVIQEGRAVGLADDMFIKRIEGLDELPELRALKGEVIDPKKVFMSTISDMANTLAGANFYRGVGRELGTNLEDGLERVAKGELPAIIRSVDRRGAATPDVAKARSGADVGNAGTDAAIIAADDRLKSLGYVRIGMDDTGELTTGVFGGKFADMTGAYVRPEVKDALTTPARMGLDGLGQAVAIGATLKGQAQRMAIVPNPISQVRNIYGNLMYLAGNGNLGRDSDFVDTFRLIAANVDHMDDAGFARFSQELGALGVMDTSLVTSALRDYRDFAQKFSASEKVSNVFGTINKAIPFMKQFEKLYSESDSFFKLMAVFSEQSKMTNALGKAGLDVLGSGVSSTSAVGIRSALAKNLVDSGLAKRAGSLAVADSPSNLLLTMAGDTVKDTMPVYSRIGKAVRVLDAIPVVGNFTSFASENIRNSYNTMHRGLKELSFRVDDDLKKIIGKERAGILERQIRGIGSQRLISFLAVSAGTPAAVTKASMLATGTTQEEMDAAESLVGEFYQGHALGVISNDGRGRMQLFDQSFVNPYGFVRDPIINAMRTFQEKGELNASDVEKITAASWAGILGYLEPFASESIIFERALDVLPSSWLGRGGETQTGSKIYQDGESLGSKVSQGVTHMLSAYIPGYARMATEERGGELQAGRLYRALSGQPGTRGQTFTGNEELARAVTGMTPITLNTREDFTFKGGEYLPLRSSAKSVATRVIKRADSTVEQMTESWNTYLDNLYREQSKLYYNVQQARKLNATDTDLTRQLKSAGLGAAEVKAILDGRFWPGLASKELIKEIRMTMRSEDRAPRVIQDIPWGTFNGLSNDVRNQPLSPEVGAQERAARLAAKRAKIAQETDAAIANVGQGQVQAPVPLVQEVVQPTEPQTLLDTASGFVSNAANTIGDVGTDIIESAKTFAPSYFGDRKNQEIAERAQRGQ